MNFTIDLIKNQLNLLNFNIFQQIFHFKFVKQVFVNLFEIDEKFKNTFSLNTLNCIKIKQGKSF